jgi:hypothetical protein
MFTPGIVPEMSLLSTIRLCQHNFHYKTSMRDGDLSNKCILFPKSKKPSCEMAICRTHVSCYPNPVSIHFRRQALITCFRCFAADHGNSTKAHTTMYLQSNQQMFVVMHKTCRNNGRIKSTPLPSRMQLINT